MSMHVEIVSAERQLFSGEATEVQARSLAGEIAILPGHQPALLALDIAPVRVKTVDGDVEWAAVHHGFLYFQHDHLVVLADVAEVASEIDQPRAESRLRELERQWADEDHAELREAIRRQEVRLAVAPG